MSQQAFFWQRKTLAEMSREEWESLCDGCGRCCLHKLQDDDTDEVYYTDIHCRYMQRDNCRCTVYLERQKKVPNCVWLTPEQASEFHWLPETCAYRLLAEGYPLFDWHPLISGDPDSVHKAGISIANAGVPDDKVPEDEWEDHIIWKA
ncbi:YcgN family cysteine cluster protein [Oceanobacter mangrovi]|uniref:YcgN family cysteine cluster protein n=1 Tax=Oceanobacter mangrovi TaxID=2862510 RepID=UPI001C8DFEAE|nr:YcgN family cysteine cluster protein [Oceanobacter mangrovi]